MVMPPEELQSNNYKEIIAQSESVVNILFTFESFRMSTACCKMKLELSFGYKG